MRTQRLEARVLDIVEHMRSGQRVEDDRVELKAEWPSDHRKAARQIAALANTAGGEPVLRVVGLDEDAGSVTNVDGIEVAEWWGQVDRCFDEVAPEPRFLSVPVSGGQRVTAIEFDTSRAPYVVTTEGKTGVHREIPWRSGNSTRSAKRSEILRSVLAEASVPRLTLIDGSLTITKESHHPDQYKGGFDQALLNHDLRAQLSVRFFVEATGPSMLPAHLWSCQLIAEDATTWDMVAQLQGPQASAGSSAPGGTRYESRGTIQHVPNSGLHIAGSDSMTLHGNRMLGVFDANRAPLQSAGGYDVGLHLPIALSRR